MHEKSTRLEWKSVIKYFFFSELIWECAHALRHLLQRQTGDLAGQLLSTGMVNFLLELLASPLPSGFCF